MSECEAYRPSNGTEGMGFYENWGEVIWGALRNPGTPRNQRECDDPREDGRDPGGTRL